MRLRGTGLVLCLFVALLLGVGSLGASSATGSPSASCGPGDGKTLLGGRRVRVYEVSGPQPTGGSRRFDESLAFGCLIPRGHPRLLGSTSSSLAVYRNKKIGSVDTDTFELRPPWIAYTKTISGIDTWNLRVDAVNLRTNRRNFCGVGLGGPDGPRPAPNVAQITLAGDGTVAWTGSRLVAVPRSLAPIYVPPGVAPPPIALPAGRANKKQVVVCDQTGEQVLDSGEGIDLHSLKLHGSTLNWTDFGQTRTAQLP